MVLEPRASPCRLRQCGAGQGGEASNHHFVFATYMLPHMLFVADFEESERIVRVCCLAWYIGLFPDAAECQSVLEWRIEPRRVCRRLVSLSHAAMARVSRLA
jgi:hypothetical protein